MTRTPECVVCGEDAQACVVSRTGAREWVCSPDCLHWLEGEARHHLTVSASGHNLSLKGLARGILAGGARLARWIFLLASLVGFVWTVWAAAGLKW